MTFKAKPIKVFKLVKNDREKFVPFKKPEDYEFTVQETSDGWYGGIVDTHITLMEPTEKKCLLRLAKAVLELCYSPYDCERERVAPHPWDEDKPLVWEPRYRAGEWPE